MESGREVGDVPGGAVTIGTTAAVRGGKGRRVSGRGARRAAPGARPSGGRCRGDVSGGYARLAQSLALGRRRAGRRSASAAESSFSAALGLAIAVAWPATTKRGLTPPTRCSGSARSSAAAGDRQRTDRGRRGACVSRPAADRRLYRLWRLAPRGELPALRPEVSGEEEAGG